MQLPDGTRAGLIATDDMDVAALDPSRRGAVLAAFGRLCRTLDMPVQLLVRVRPVLPATAIAEANAGRLELAMQTHWTERLRDGEPHVRSIMLAARARTAGQLDVAVGRFMDSVRACGVAARRLAGVELPAMLGDGLRLRVPVPWREHAAHLEVGTMYVRGFTLRRLPGHAVAAGWLAPLLAIAVECDIAIHLAPASLSDALSSLGRRLRDFSAHRMLEAERGVIGDAHVDVALDSAFTLRARLARNLGRALHLSVTAAVRAESLDELHRRSDAVRLAFVAASMGAEPAHFRHLAAFITTLPLATDALGGGKLVESGAAASCVPWVDAGGIDPHGYRIGMTQRTGVPVRLDPFDTMRHPNANIAVFAASGHGKSFALGTIVLEAAAHGVDSVIIDPEGEYRGVVDALGGSYLALAPGSGAAVNVLDSGSNDVDDAAAAVVDLVAVLCGGRLDDVERALIDSAARDACARASCERRIPLLADCLPALEASAPRVATVVRRFCTGALGELFNRETSVRIDRGICAISLQDMPEEHVGAATLILARWLWDLVRRDRRRRHIVFDEVGSLCAHPPLRTLLVQLARRCRKHGASLVVATQNAQDLLGTDEGRVVATNCAIVLLGGHRAAETSLMERAYGLTEAQRHALETSPRGEFLLMAGNKRVEIRVDVPDLHRSILPGAP